MLLTIPDIISAEDLSDIRAKAKKLRWEDGAKTAGATAAVVKKNEQANLKSGDGLVLHEGILKAVSNHPIVKAAAHPKQFSRLLLSRTGVGGGYGFHIDNAIMGKAPNRIRTDLSYTLFLSDPENYDGGELIMDAPGMVQSLKPEAGTLVLYSTCNIHKVAEVTRGTRLACVGWIQSQIRDNAQRELLFDLENLRAELRHKHGANSPELQVLNKSISNLVRMWAEV